MVYVGRNKYSFHIISLPLKRGIGVLLWKEWTIFHALKTAVESKRVEDVIGASDECDRSYHI